MSEESYDKLLESLLMNGYSPSALRATPISLGLGYSPKDMDVITKELRTFYYDHIQRELPEDVFVLFLDVCPGEMKDKEKRKVKTVTICTVIGISFEWNKSLYGFYIHQAVEKKEGWLQIFNDLISRGLRKVTLINSDVFLGLKEVIAELFPQTDLQLCLTHFKRNITRNMSKEQGRALKERFNLLKACKSYDQGLKGFEALFLDFRAKDRGFMTQVWPKRENCVTFLPYPEPICGYIYTTNTSKNFRHRQERILERMGGFSRVKRRWGSISFCSWTG
jgi:transposase-like protein